MLCRYFAKEQDEKYGFSWELDESDYKDEIWKEIPKEFLNGLENYKISNYGRLKSPADRIRSPRINDTGYCEFFIHSKLYKAHRLVAQIFLDNPENKPHVNHKDKNRSNNHISNLEWVTISENMLHARNYELENLIEHVGTETIAVGGAGIILKHTSKPTGKKVVQYNLDGTKLAEYKSISNASKETKLSTASISDCCNEKIEKVRGFVFKFE